jgi:competence protein ComEC
MIGVILVLPPVYKWIASRARIRLGEAVEQLRIPSGIFLPLMMLFLALGAIRYQLGLPKLNLSFIAYYNDATTETILQGVVSEPADVRDTYTNLRVQVELLRSANRDQFAKVSGVLLARIPNPTTYTYGDRVQLQGKLQTPPENEDFSYRDYLANQGIYSYLPNPTISLIQTGQGNPVMRWLYSFRQSALQTIYILFPDPEASLLGGILLGVESGISPQLQEAFRQTGTSHIIVISGFNITIIAGLFILLFSRLLGRYKGAMAAAVGIILYTILVGANAAVVRAAILGLLALLGHLVGRRQSGLNSLTFVAGVMAVISPTVLWDVSFQLSFAATLGIILYAEPMTEWFIGIIARYLPQEKAEKLAGPVSEYFLLTLAAQLTTLPLMIFYFKRLSLTALIANPLILPAQPALMVLGGIAVLTGLAIRPIGQLFAWAAWPFTAYTIRLVEWLSTIPHGSVALGQVAVPAIVLFYVLLMAATFARSQLKNLAGRFTPAIPLSVLGVVTVLIWKAAFYAPDAKLHVTVLDVGTGEAVLVQSPTGRAVLINGGASTNKLSDALGRRLPYFDRSLDWLMVADIDEEDLAGLAGNLERFEPRNVLWAGNYAGTRAAGDLWTRIGNLSIPTTRMQAGQALELGNGARLSALSVGDKGAVLWLEWGNFRMLLPMGMDVQALKTLQNSMAMRNLSALLLAESGYAPVNPSELIRQLHPQLVVLSVAAADRTGLPSPETIQALDGYNLLRTDQNGWIEISTDGRQMWVEVERK